MNRTNKAKPELIILKQGIRLMEFYISHNFKGRSEFARHIGVSSSSINEVIWNHKPISDDMFLRIKAKFPDVDEDWLRRGIDSKLLTDNLKFRIVENVEETVNPYAQKCLNCIAKDKIIETLRTELDDLRKEYIDCLKELSGLKKASSG